MGPGHGRVVGEREWLEWVGTCYNLGNATNFKNKIQTSAGWALNPIPGELNQTS